MYEKIKELLDERKISAIRDYFSNENPVDIALMFEDIPEEDFIRFFRLLPKEEAAEVFSYMSKEAQQTAVELITDRELSGIIDELFLDDTVDLIEEMPANVVKRVLANTDKHKRALINKFLQYKDDTAGSCHFIRI